MKLADNNVIYRFDGFTLDLWRGELFAANGEQVPLRRKSFDLLRLLLENAGRLLDRDAINQAVWPDVTIADEGITQCVRDIRRALGDAAQLKLRTVRRRGYIFAPEVAREVKQSDPGSVILADKPAIAVLAFTNLTGDSEQEYLSDGISDAIITELARSRSLFVIARTSSFNYKDRSVDIKQVAHELSVRYVLEGSVQRSSGRIRITAQLIDAASGVHIWAERFDRALADLFAIQDEITRSMVAAIDPAIALMERQRAMQKPPENLSAWEAWQRALWHWSKGGDLGTRRDFLQRAIALDPNFAPAHAMLAWIYLSEITRGLGRPRPEGLRMAEAAARTALDLDPHSAIAHAGLAWVLNHRGDSPAALEEAEIATFLSPNDPQGHLVKGHILSLSGQPFRAQAPLTTALQLDPHGPIAPAVMHNRAVACYLERNYALAATIKRRTVQAYPEHPRSFLWLAAALGQLGHTDEAHTALDSAIKASPMYFSYKTGSRAPYMRPDDHEHLLDGLRKAGWQQ